MLSKLTRFITSLSIPDSLVKLWWGFIYFIVLMSFWRLVFLCSQYRFLEISKWTLYLMSFLVGLRLDAMVASYLILPLSLMALIPLFTSKDDFLKYFSIPYIFLLTLLISLFNLVDIFVFQEFDTHLDFLTLKSYLWQKDSMEFIFEEYPVFPALLLLLLLSWAAFTLYWKVKAKIKAKPSWIFTKIFGVIFSIIILGTAIRGGWQERPLDWGYAMFSPDFTANQTALNSLFFLGRSVVQFSSESKSSELTQYYDPEDAFQTTLKILENPALTFVDDVSMTRELDVLRDNGYNIILFILESHTAAFAGYLNPEKPSVTPNLDRMAKQGFAFTNCYANGIRSAHGISSIIMSWPNLPGLPLISRTESVNGAPSLGSALKTIGYSTLFIYGGDSQFDNMNGFLSANGFDQVIDRKDFSPREAGTKWGIFDHTVLNRTLEEIDRSSKPVFLTLFTTTNHQPWKIPPAYEALIPVFPDSLYHQGQVHRSMAYVDHALGEFMDQATQHDWYDKSIFVVIADHGLAVHKSPFSKIQNAHIPFVIYAPGLALEPQIITQPVSQIDVAPTLLGLIDYSRPFTFFGQNVLTTESGVACKITGDEAYWLQDDYLYFERFGQETLLYRVQFPVEKGAFELVIDPQLFGHYQQNFRSYLQTGSSQFKTFGTREN